MKLKLFIICAGLVTMSTLSSCKKDWTCKCDTGGTSDSHLIENETLLNARNKCKSYEGSFLGATTTCKLD